MSDQIKEALKSIMHKNDLDTFQVWQGCYAGINGWFYSVADRHPTYMGRTVQDALEWIESAKIASD